MKRILNEFFWWTILIVILGLCSSVSTAQTCSLRQIGSVNSGSGIGVSYSWSDGRNADRYVVTVGGIQYPYPGTARAISIISGCGFASTVRVDGYYGGQTCSITSTGSAPHSAPCTAGNAANSSTAVSAASYSDLLSPGSIVAVFGENFTTQTGTASSLPLPTSLAGVKVYAFYNTPLQRECGIFYVNPKQVNVLLPADLPYGGAGTLAVINLAEDTLRPTWFYLNQREPGIFTRDQDGHGSAAGYFDRGFYVFFGTGFGNATSGFLLSGGNRYQASFVGPAPGFAGLGQVNVAAPLPSGAQVQFCASVNDDARCSQFFLLP